MFILIGSERKFMNDVPLTSKPHVITGVLEGNFSGQELIRV